MLVLLAWICGKEAEDRNDDLMGDIKKKRERERERYTLLLEYLKFKHSVSIFLNGVNI